MSEGGQSTAWKYIDHDCPKIRPQKCPTRLLIQAWLEPTQTDTPPSEIQLGRARVAEHLVSQAQEHCTPDQCGIIAYGAALTVFNEASRLAQIDIDNFNRQ